MTAHTPSDAKAKVAFVSAQASALRCTPKDAAAAIDLLTKLKELEVCVDHSNSVSLRPLCSLAGKLCERMVQAEIAPREELIDWIRSLLDFVGQSMGVRPDEAAATALRTPTTLSSTGVRSRLALVDGQRLGEILVRMSYLRIADVERAIALAKSKGCMLGEALVELALLSKEELDAALRVQKARRIRDVDPWMTSGPHGDVGKKRRRTGTD